MTATTPSTRTTTPAREPIDPGLPRRGAPRTCQPHGGDRFLFASGPVTARGEATERYERQLGDEMLRADVGLVLEKSLRAAYLEVDP